jgi:hypothetical protein
MPSEDQLIICLAHLIICSLKIETAQLAIMIKRLNLFIFYIRLAFNILTQKILRDMYCVKFYG